MMDDQFHFEGYDWQNRQILGEGGFGKVFKVRNFKHNEDVAVKQMAMSNFDEEYKMNALKTQIQVMKETSSQHTVRMLDYKIGKVYTYIVLQLCSGDLKKLLEKNGQKLPEDVCVEILIQILEGFKVLLNKGYIHRDVKPQNVLIKNNVYKLADYGFTRKVNVDREVLNEICGTPLYMAPQLLYSKEYSSKCDIWSLGIMFYEMIFGFSPWPTRHFEVYKRSIVTRPVSFPYKCSIGVHTQNFLEGCLKLEENDRMSWHDVFNHPLIKQRNKGVPMKQILVSDHAENILTRVQESSARKLINSKQLFIKYEKYQKIDHQMFHKLMIEIDPQISTYESEMIFRTADLSKDGFVNLNQFSELFLNVDYRPIDDIAARRIQEIVAMAQEKNLNIRQFFDLFDKDKSSEIDQEEFKAFIRYIAPKIKDIEIMLMWRRFDVDKSGSITMKQFVDELTRGVPNQGSMIIQNRERAKRNVQCMKDFLHQKKMNAEQVFGKAKVANKQGMRIQQFGPFVKQINYIISQQEIIDMFGFLDHNNSKYIEIHELQEALGY